MEVRYFVGAAPAQSDTVQNEKRRSLGGFVGVCCFTFQL